ncbi:hypothetical protein [Synechococcus sp. PCC 7336]|uniref:hypothetical protein n=1 Tax=Synechococcus sp. PCC 7336 TaxID=195250 RepID=UPI00034B1F25|nr:hypothetical protein [Synechococcus sp. PCC 7336]
MLLSGVPTRVKSQQPIPTSGAGQTISGINPPEPVCHHILNERNKDVDARDTGTLGSDR